MQNRKNHLTVNESSQPKLFRYLIGENNENNLILRYSNPERLKNSQAKVSSYFFNKDNKVMNSLSLFFSSSAANSTTRDGNRLSFLEQGKDLQVRLNNLEGSIAKSKRWYLIEDLQKILVTYFKNMYSLISKAKFKVYAEKITIEILYYITIPDANIFTYFMIFNKQYLNKSNSLLSLERSSLLNISNRDRKSTKKINYLKRKNRLIQLLKKSISKIRKRERFFKLNLISINYLYESKFNSLVKFFNYLFQKPIEFLLIRLHHSDADSNILAQLVLLVLKKKNIRRIINKLYNKKKVKDINKMKFSSFNLKNNNSLLSNKAVASEKNEYFNKFIPVYLSGLYIHIGGRLMREPIIPRRTTKKFEKGAIAVGKVNSLEETSITKKNRKGAYTIKIIFAQNLIK